MNLDTKSTALKEFELNFWFKELSTSPTSDLKTMEEKGRTETTMLARHQLIRLTADVNSIPVKFPLLITVVLDTTYSH
jgi:hypothetical protein